MSEEDILIRVKLIFTEVFKIKDQDIKLESRIVNDFAIDSVDAISMSYAVSRVFKIKIDEYDMSYLFTVGDIVKFIKEKLNQKSVKEGL